MEEVSQAGAEVLRTLLVQLLDDVEAANRHGVSVLLKATSNGHSSIVQLLLPRFNSQPAAGAVAAAEGVATDGDHSALISLVVADAFLAGATKGRAQCLDIFLALCSPCHLVAAQDKIGCNALMLAAYNNHPDCIRLLLSHSGEGQLEACTTDELPCIGSDMMFRVGSTSLMMAAAEGHAECAVLLLEHCPAAQVAAVDVWKKSALYLASREGHVGCVRLLLAHSPREQVEAANVGGFTALMAAAGWGHADCVRLLLEHSPCEQVVGVNMGSVSALMMAASWGRADCVRLLLEHSPCEQVAAVNKDGYSPLTWAAEMGHHACVQLLLAYSPLKQVAAVDQGGANALIHAARWGETACVQLLLAHNPGAQVAVVCSGPHNDNALMSAACRGHANCVKLLLAHSQDTQQLDSTLLKACRAYQREETAAPDVDLSSNTQCMELLMAAGAFVGSDASAADVAVATRVTQELANRALVADRVNEAVGFLALTHNWKWKASSQDET